MDFTSSRRPADARLQGNLSALQTVSRNIFLWALADTGECGLPALLNNLLHKFPHLPPASLQKEVERYKVDVCCAASSPGTKMKRILFVGSRLARWLRLVLIRGEEMCSPSCSSLALVTGRRRQRFVNLSSL
jgi:hypothetical protein